MPSMLAIVSKSVFEKEARRSDGQLLEPGDVYETGLYRSKSKGLAPLADGGALFLVTVRPGDRLWLVAVLEDVAAADGGWSAAINATPVRDITADKSKLVFTTGSGIKAKPGRLGMSLQSPRTLTDADVALLRGEARPAAKAKPAVRRRSGKVAKKGVPKTAAPTKAAPKKAKPKRAPAAKNDSAWTVERLLARWQTTRHPRVAAVLAALGAARESAEATELRTAKKVPQAAWLERLETIDLVDRGALLSRLLDAPAAKVRERVMALEAWGDDPRVADALHDTIEAVPWVSTGTRKTWTQVFRRLRAIGDPRTAEVATNFRPEGIGSSWTGPAEWMGKQLARLANDITTVAQPLDDDELASLDALASELEASSDAAGPPRAASERAEAAMAHALANPDDDVARMVLADALQEIGDVRGELIVLQADKPTRASRKRVREIIADHRDELLGALAPAVLVRGLEFRLGFVEACETTDHIHQHHLDAMQSSPLASTIRRLRTTVDTALLPSFTSLRTVELTGWTADVEPLLRHPTPLPFTSLTTRVGEGQARIFERCTSLPDLRTLKVLGAYEVAAAIAATAFARRLDALHINVPERLGELAALVASQPDSQVREVGASAGLFSTDSADWTIELILRRTDAGWSEAALDVRLPSPTWRGSMDRAMIAIKGAVGSIADLPIASFNVTSQKAVRDEATRDRLARAVGNNATMPWS